MTYLLGQGKDGAPVQLSDELGALTDILFCETEQGLLFVEQLAVYLQCLIRSIVSSANTSYIALQERRRLFNAQNAQIQRE